MRITTCSRFSLSFVFATIACSTQSAPPPDDEPASARVGPAGGTVTAGGATVQIPAGALSAETTVTVQPVASTELPSLPATTLLAGEPLAFTPHGLTFATPVTLTLPYGGEADTVWRLDDENDTTWEPVAEATFDGAAASVTTSTFSIYGVGRRNTSYLFTCCNLPQDDCGLVGNGACDCGADARWEAAECPDELYAESITGPGAVSQAYGPPTVSSGYVYWSDLEGVIARVALNPGAEIEVLYREAADVMAASGQVSIIAVGATHVYFFRNWDAGSAVGRVELNGTDAEPSWIINDETKGLQPGGAFIANGCLYMHSWASSGIVRLDTGTIEDRTLSLLSPVDRDYCLPAPNETLLFCAGIEVDLAAETSWLAVEGWSAGASNDTHWFIAPTNDPPFVITRVAHRTGDSLTLPLTTSSFPSRAGATATHFYSWHDCHELSWVETSGEHAGSTREVYLAFEGPCISWMHVDDQYAYLNTWALGLLRVELARLRGE